MRYALLLPLLLLLSLLATAPSYAQQPDSSAPPRSDWFAPFRPPPALDRPDTSFANAMSHREALEAARVDPGILHYAVPPPGTVMPHLMPSDSIDPGIIYPRPDSVSRRHFLWRPPRHR